jgi:hypothetical protein
MKKYFEFWGVAMEDASVGVLVRSTVGVLVGGLVTGSLSEDADLQIICV